MKEYIQWYTTGGTILPLLPPTIDGAPVRTLRINIESLDGSTISFNGVHNPPADCNPATLDSSGFAEAEKKNIDGEEIIYRSMRFAKRVDLGTGRFSFTLDGNHVEMEVAAWVIGKSQKDTFADDNYIPDRDRFGLHLAQRGVIIQRHYSWITSSPMDCNYHVVVNCDQFELNADRTRIKGKSNKLYRAVKTIFDERFKTKILNVGKELKKLRDEENKQELFLTTRTTNRQNVQEVIAGLTDGIDVWPFSNVSVGLGREPQTELEVCGILCALLAQHQTQFPFTLHSLSPTGTDAVVGIKDQTTNLVNYTLYEIEKELNAFLEHGHSAELANAIVCWSLGKFDGRTTGLRFRGSDRYGYYHQNELIIYPENVTATKVRNGTTPQLIKRIPVIILKDICQTIAGPIV